MKDDLDNIIEDFYTLKVGTLPINNKSFMTNKYVRSFVHAVVVGLVFVLPLVLKSGSPVLDMSVSSVINWAYLHLVVLS